MALESPSKNPKTDMFVEYIRTDIGQHWDRDERSSVMREGGRIEVATQRTEFR